MSRRLTILEKRWPHTPEFLQAAGLLAESAVRKMLVALWAGYDQVVDDILAQVDVGDGGEQAERVVTELLHFEVDKALGRDGPFFCGHAVREYETRLPAPAQPPEYDLAFVLRSNRRIAWPVEAKLLRTAGAVAPYVADVREQFLTCRYGPFSSGGAMLGYLITGRSCDAIDNIAVALAVPLEVFEPFAARNHRISQHNRIVPVGRTYPSRFDCHHLIMPLIPQP